MQRRVEQPDGDRQAVHRLEDLDEVLALQRQQRVERVPRRSSSVSARISRSTSWRRSPRNMCSVRHRPMPCGAEPAGPRGVLGGVGVGAHRAAGALVGVRHDPVHGRDQRRRRRRRPSASPSKYSHDRATARPAPRRGRPRRWCRRWR